MPHLSLRSAQPSIPGTPVTGTGTYEKDSLFNARNTVKEAKYPVFRPIVWQVLAYDRLSCDSKVRAQPAQRGISHV